MAQFSIKFLIFLTSVVAALFLMLRAGPTWSGFFGYAMYTSLIVSWLFYQDRRDERLKRQQEVAEDNPAARS